MSAPASARARAIACPIPLVPPVTRAVWPAREKSSWTVDISVVFSLVFNAASSLLFRVYFSRAFLGSLYIRLVLQISNKEDNSCRVSRRKKYRHREIGESEFIALKLQSRTFSAGRPCIDRQM
jgi:hypothetical protein